MVVKALFIMVLVAVLQAAWALDEDFDDKVRESAVLSEQEQILLQSDTYFYPGKKGFSLFSGGGDRVKAYFLLTQDALYVLDRERGSDVYEVVLRERLQDISSVEIVGGSIALRLVTENRDSGQFNSFELLDSRNSVGTNAARTQKAKDLIATGIQGLDPRVATDSQRALQHQQTLQSLQERIERLEKQQMKQQGVSQQPAVSEPKAECDCTCPPQSEE